MWQNDERNPEDRVASPSRDDLYREGPCGLGFKRWIGVHQVEKKRRRYAELTNSGMLLAKCDVWEPVRGEGSE